MIRAMFRTVIRTVIRTVFPTVFRTVFRTVIQRAITSPKSFWRMLAAWIVSADSMPVARHRCLVEGVRACKLQRILGCV